MLMSSGAVYGISDSNLVAQWKFDEGSGTTAYDSAGNHDGTIYGAQWTAGVVGGALSFDAEADYVQVADDNSLDMKTEVTISAWIKLTGPQGQYVLIVAKGGNGDYEGPYGLCLDQSGQFLAAYIGDGHDWNMHICSACDPLTHYESYHVAMTYSTIEKTIRLYINGGEVLSETESAPLIDTPAPLGIGAFKYRGAWGNFFCGVIDGVQLYEQALSGEEISQMYSGTPPSVYYVDAVKGNDNNTGLTPETAFATIQKGIDTAEDGCSVMVYPGIYTGDGNRDLDFKGKAITVRSADPNDPNVVAATIIHCYGSEENPHRGFYFHTGEDANSILEGFTITNGYGPNQPFGASTYSAGGAIYCNNSSPTIRDCVIRNNYAGFWGAGIWFDNSDSKVENCTLKENVSADTGGGIYNRLSGITVSNCQFIANSAPAGGGMYNVDGGPAIRSTIFVGNLATLRGGAVRNNRATAAFVNSMFLDNHAPAGGAMHNKDSENTTAKNCILWGNSDSEIEGDAKVSYCDVQGGCPGEGNIDADPCFADASAGDYHLKSQAGRWDPDSASWLRDEVTSRCIDGGDPMNLVGREPFPHGGRINIGIYAGTAEASKSYFGEPVCEEAIGGDANGDCRVDFRDFMIMALHWCEANNP